MFATSLRNHLIWLVFISGMGFLLIAVMGPRVNADLLSKYTSNFYQDYYGGIDNLYGNTYGDDGFFFHAFTADLEYAVCYQSAFGKTFPNRYIYAYQIVNHAEGDGDPFDSNNWNSDDSYAEINYFSIATTGNPLISYEDESGMYYVHDSGNALAGWSWNGNSMDADFFSNSQWIMPGEHSAIIYFTSPYGPTRDHATMTGGAGSNMDDPSVQPFTPIPEPATVVLTLIGAMALFLANAVRRIYTRY